MHKTNDAVPMKNDTEKGNEHKVLLTQINWDELFFYQKSDVLYQLTFAFCKTLAYHRSVDAPHSMFAVGECLGSRQSRVVAPVNSIAPH